MTYIDEIPDIEVTEECENIPSEPYVNEKMKIYLFIFLIMLAIASALLVILFPGESDSDSKTALKDIKIIERLST